MAALYRIPTLADGHCLLHAVRTSWEDEMNMAPPSLQEMKCKIFEESVCYISRYLPFCPSYTKLTYLKDMSKYLLHKHYDSPYGDLVPMMISNSFRIKLNIMNNEGWQHQSDTSFSRFSF